MSKVKYPYNINVLAQKIALMKLDEAAKDKAVAEIVGQRFRLEKELAKCPEGKGIYSSDANFLLVRFENPDEVYERLLAGGVIVRNRSKVSGCEGCLRITVGTPVENDRLLRLLSSSVAEPVEATTPGMEILGERHIRIVRNTKETKIALELDLDSIGGSGHISTGLPFFDHMLEQIPNHGGVSRARAATGDLQVGAPHTLEAADWKREKVVDLRSEMFSHFLQSVCAGAKCNLHIRAEGVNEHHKAEAIFKAFARALRMAVAKTPFPYELPSSKGIL